MENIFGTANFWGEISKTEKTSIRRFTAQHSEYWRKSKKNFNKNLKNQKWEVSEQTHFFCNVK